MEGAVGLYASRSCFVTLVVINCTGHGQLMMSKASCLHASAVSQSAPAGVAADVCIRREVLQKPQSEQDIENTTLLLCAAPPGLGGPALCGRCTGQEQAVR